jgi:hypothetical protein
MVEPVVPPIVPPVNQTTVNVDISKVFGESAIVNIIISGLWQELFNLGSSIKLVTVPRVDCLSNWLLVTMSRDPHEENSVVHSSPCLIQAFFLCPVAVVSKGHEPTGLFPSLTAARSWMPKRLLHVSHCQGVTGVSHIGWLELY